MSFVDDVDVAKTGREPYEVHTLTLQAGKSELVPGDLRFFTIKSATAANSISVSFTGSRFSDYPLGFLMKGFVAPSIWIKNTSGAPNTIVFIKGWANLEDNRILLSALSAVPVSLGASAVAVGAFVAGALATGAIVDLGAKADAVAGTDTGTFSLIALFKRALQGITTALASLVTGNANTLATAASVNLIDVDLGAKADAAATTDTGTFSLIALVKRLLTKFAPTVAYVVNSLATTNDALIATGARTVKSVQIFNASGGAVYVRLFDKATAPIPGTDTPYRVYAVPTLTTFDLVLPAGDAYTLGLGIAITAGAPVLDATAVGAGDVQATVNYV